MAEKTDKYYRGVLETVKLIRLISIQLQGGKGEKTLDEYLNEIETKAAIKSGTTPLSEELELPNTLSVSDAEAGDLKDSDYWGGVADVIELIKSFGKWKAENPDARREEDILEEIKRKAEQKLGPSASPLATALGISFEPRSSPPEILSEMGFREEEPEKSLYTEQPPIVPSKPKVSQPSPKIIEIPLTLAIDPKPLSQEMVPPTPRKISSPQSTAPTISEEVEIPVSIDSSLSPKSIEEPLQQPAVQPMEPTPSEPISGESTLTGSTPTDSAMVEPTPVEQDAPKNEDWDEDELLSSSLRSALKMLRDEGKDES